MHRKLKKLLAINFDRIKNAPVKQGRVFGEYENSCGILKENNQWIRQIIVTTHEQMTKELGVDGRTFQRLKKLQTQSPDLQELISDGM